MTRDRSAISISLNGADNVGKTTHLRWLASAMPAAVHMGTIDRWHPRWRAVASGDFAGWWFADSSTEEHVGLVFASHRQRRLLSGPLALEDRGRPMLLALCAATAMVKEQLSAERALDRVSRFASVVEIPARDEFHMMLRHTDGAPEVEARTALEREPRPTSPWYADYQLALAEVLALQAERAAYDVIVVRGNQPLLQIQRTIRDAVASLDAPVRRFPARLPQRVWLLGGMSESGKSTFGGLLRDEHGVTRLKIGYLLEVAALRAGVVDPYMAWSEPEQAERLVEELLHLAASSKADRLSLESAHRLAATEHLRRILGDRCRIVYIDADKETRAGRARESPASLQERDRTKAKRGADRIAAIADHVIDHTGPRSALTFAVTRLVRQDCKPRVAPRMCRPVRNAEWLEIAAEHLADEQVALVLATGSTAIVSWRDGWSDLDLLVVRDRLPLAWLREVAGTLRAPAGIKLSLSCFTTGDLAAGRVPPRVVHALRSAAGGTGVLHRRDDYRMPVPSRAADDCASRGELGLVLVTTRRLLAAEHPGVRALHKHMVLLAKILLRADGIDVDDADDVLTVFVTGHPRARIGPPLLAELAQPSDPNICTAVLSATARLVEYVDELDRCIHPNDGGRS